MLDLKIYDEDQYDLVPVPLPGRLMIFAGPDGLMCRRNDGTIVAYPAAAGGGGLVEPVGSITFETTADPTDIPIPPQGACTLAVLGTNILVRRDWTGFVQGYTDGGVFFDPSGPGPE